MLVWHSIDYTSSVAGVIGGGSVLQEGHSLQAASGIWGVKTVGGELENGIKYAQSFTNIPKG